MTSTEEILEERGKTHGDYKSQFALCQSLKNTIGEYGPHMDPVYEECIDMFCMKISRIVCGDASEKDHWDDIAGYATLGSKYCGY